MASISTGAVRSYWESHPLCAAAIPYPIGTPEYFDYYDKLREENESVRFSHSLHEYAAFRGRRVLDIGCGNGYVLSRYAQAGAEVHGVDLTQAGVDLCKKRFNRLHLKGDFRAADAEHLPFEDASFDCVCSMGVLHHVPDTAAAVEEIWRVLKPGGRLIIMMYHRNSALYRILFRYESKITGKTLQQLVNEVDGVGNPKGDVYSRRELGALLSRFKDLEMFCGDLKGGHILPRGGRMLPSILLKPLERQFGWFLYAKGQKP